MKISAAGVELIRSFEGYHRKLPNGDCTTYLCPAGVPTIGFGCTEGVKMGMVWTRAEAEAGLIREIAKFEAAVDRLVTIEVNQNQFDAMVSLAYNIGLGSKKVPGFSTSTVLRKTNAGDFKGAASGFKLWNKARNPKTGKLVVLNGLVDRRAREATLFLTPVTFAEEPAMPQSVEQSAAKPSASAVAAGGAAVGGAATQVIPAPPETVTQTVTDLTMWQTVVTTGQSLLTWGWDNLALVGGIGVTVVGLTIVNGRRTSE
jgi:GH24 family phage-related lysozyme (muramidase)